MTGIVSRLSAVMLMLILMAGAVLAAPSPETIEAMRTSIVHIRVTGIQASNSAKLTAEGSGFIVSPDGFVLTNYHLLDALAGADADTINFTVSIGTNSETRVKALPINGSEITDILLLKLPEATTPYAAVTQGSAADLALGTDLFTLGFPRKDDPQFQSSAHFRDGALSSREGPTGSLWTVSIAFAPGLSGSPVFTDNGNVVGIAKAISANDADTRYMIPIHFADSMLAHLKVAALQRDLQLVLKALGGAEKDEVPLQNRLKSVESSIGELREVFDWTASLEGESLVIKFKKLVGGNPQLRGIEPWVRPIAMDKEGRPVKPEQFNLDKGVDKIVGEQKITLDDDSGRSGSVILPGIKRRIGLRLEDGADVHAIPELEVRVVPVLSDDTKLPFQTIFVRVNTDE